MPGRDYVGAYEAFERSLGDLSYPRTISPRSFKTADSRNGSRYENGVPFKPIPPQSMRRQLQDVSASRNRPATTYNNLPASPPAQVTSSDDSDAPAIPVRSSHRKRISTPPTNWSVPTPDTTPPSLVHNPTPDLSDSRWDVSSRSDSFATAKEDQVSQSAAGSQVGLPIQGTEQISSHRKGLKNLGWGMGSPDLDDESIIRNQHDGVSTSTWNLWNPAKESERALNSNQVIQHRHPTAIPGQFEVTFLDDEIPLQDESPDQSSNQSSWLEESSVENLAATRNVPRKRVRESSRKDKTHLSRPSRESAVVEATIVESPQPRKGKGRLRHVSKNLDLRDEASSIPIEDRTSTASDSPKIDQTQEIIELYRDPPFDSGQAKIPTTQDTGVVHRSKTTVSRQTNTNSTPVARGAFESPRRSRPASESFLDFSLEDLNYRGIEARKRRQNMSRSNTQRSQAPQRNSTALALTSNATQNCAHTKTVEPGVSIVPHELQHLSQLDATQHANARALHHPGASLDVSHESSRQMHLASPMSMRAETPEPLVVSEAKAVSIYPHKNDSLLVIQNPTSSIHSRETSSSLKALEERPDSQNRANITSTPPWTGSISHDVESPPQRPSEARQPPSETHQIPFEAHRQASETRQHLSEVQRPPPAAFSPPTTVDEDPENEEEDPQPEEPLPEASARRSSVVKHTRRLSDTFNTFAAAHGDVLRELGSRKRADQPEKTSASRPASQDYGNREAATSQNMDDSLPQAVPRRSSTAKRTRPLSEPLATFAGAHADVIRDIRGRKRQNRNSSAATSGTETPTNEAARCSEVSSNVDDSLPRDSSGRSSIQRGRRLSDNFAKFAGAHADVIRGSYKRRSTNSDAAVAGSSGPRQEVEDNGKRSEEGPATRPAEPGRDETANSDEPPSRVSRQSSSARQSRRLSETFTTFAAAHGDVIRGISRKRQSVNSDVDVARPTSVVDETQQNRGRRGQAHTEEPDQGRGEGNANLDDPSSRASRRSTSTAKQARRLSDQFTNFAAAHADVLRDMTGRKRSNRNSGVSVPSRPLSYASDDPPVEDIQRTPPRFQNAQNDQADSGFPRQDTQLEPVAEVSRSTLALAPERPSSRDSGDSSVRGNHRAGSVRNFIRRSVSRSRSDRDGTSQRRLSLFPSSSSSRRAAEDADQLPNNGQASSHGSFRRSLDRSFSSRSSQQGRNDSTQPSTTRSSMLQGFRDRRQDRRREKIRQSIGPVYYVEPPPIGDPSDRDPRVSEAW